MKGIVEVETVGMDCAEYKNITGHSKVLSYKVIHDTLTLLEDRTDLVDELLDMLGSSQVPKPEKHNRKDAVETTYYLVNLKSSVKVEIFKDINSRKKPGHETTGDSLQLDELAATWFKTIDEGDLI